MPKADFNEQIHTGSSGGQFIQLKKKDESITFRLADVPSYDGKHWEDKEWTHCPRIMTQNAKAECKYCEKAEITQDKEEARKLKVRVNFYFPILNRDTKEAQIFQTGLSVRNSIQDYEKNGVNVYESDWKVVRNEGDDPSRYYSVIRLDTKKLNKEDEEILAEAASIDIEGLTSKSFPKKESDLDEEDMDKIAKEV